MIYIRTDANEIIATGHVMRCLTIAEEIVNLKGKVSFIVSDEESVPLIKDRGFEYIITNSKWNDVDVESEFEILSQYINENDMLLIDSYFIKNNYIKRFINICKVATFDDMFEEKKDADIIINYNIFYKKFDYSGRYKNCGNKLLLGEKYVPLRKQFSLVQPLKEVRECIRPRVLLMCGGGDSKNFICTCLQFIHKMNSKLFNSIDWKIVVGKYYPHFEQLSEFGRKQANIDIMKNIKNIAGVMRDCDICITAASTVLYECCAMLLPTLFVVVADDQIYDAEVFSEDGRMTYCGNYNEVPALTEINILGTLENIVNNKGEQQYMKDKMSGFIESDGAYKIATELCNGLH